MKNGHSPMPDESLHSFIFRVLFRIGSFDFSTVIKRGGWARHPIVPLSARDSFKVYNSKRLINIFETSTAHSVASDLFTVHFEHLYPVKEAHMYYGDGRVPSFREAFYPTRSCKVKGKPVEIRFCYQCMCTSIEKYGFAYFKSDWLYQIDCNIHSQPLSVIDRKLSFSNVVKTVKLILRGQTSSFTLPLVNVEVSSLDKLTLQFSIVKFAPCARNKLIDYLLSNCKAYPEGYSDLVGNRTLTPEINLAVAKYRLWEGLISRIDLYYEAFLEYDYDSAISFLNENTELILTTFSDDVINNCERWLIKCKTVSCIDCSVTSRIPQSHCSSSLLIHLSKELSFRRSPDWDCDQYIRDTIMLSGVSTP
ncbi:TPA: hypothetical protein N2705_001265 [Vibrio parahaemolyticus]|nr:hypothetical protein [Vibrio parahaemolyticus]